MNTHVKKSTKFKVLSAIVLSTSLAAAGTIAFIPPTSTAYAAEAPNAQRVQLENKAVMTAAGSDGSTLISLKDAAKAAGAKISSDAKTHIFTLTQGKNSVSYEQDSDSVVVKLNGSSIGDRYEAKMIKGVSYVSIEALAAPFGYRVQHDQASGTITLTRQGQNKLSITAGKLNSKLANQSIKINIVYPVVSGVGSAKTEQTINKALKAQAEQFLSSAKSRIEKSKGPAKGDSYEFYMTYKTTLNQNGTISFLLDTYTFLGGAHGTSEQTGMTFSLTDGRFVKLSDLLQADKQANQTVKKLILAQVKQDAGSKGYTVEDFNAWTKGMTSFLDRYFMTEDGVTILVPLKNSVPSAFSTLQFQLPWNQLLKSDGSPL